MQAAHLVDRGVVKVAGEDARTFLNGLISTDTLNLKPGAARFGALLTPQGKIIADFIVVEAPTRDGGGFFLDIPRTLAKAVVGKFNMYKLRARVVIEDLSETLGVLAVWDGAATTTAGLGYADPRLPGLGLRIMLPPHRATEVTAGLGATLVDAANYEAHRIGLGIPRGGIDFAYGDAFPHESDMDQLGGVDFAKGCYVGQEVVSRMEHRGIARTRAVSVRYEGEAPAAGVAVLAGEREVGKMGSAAAGHGLALLRLDRVADALAHGQTLTAGGVVVRPIKPDWARFAFPNGSNAAK
ncbi:MAG TPA: folate-binding protein [Xanthobacteraceae bacterium]|nr:folate-binding protein [Xanthobacteraceae bacterium]